MVFSKPIMSTTELTKMGFSRWSLMAYYHRKNQRYAFKTPGSGKILFDTAEFAKELEKEKGKNR